MTQGRALATASKLHDAPYQMSQFVSAQFGRAGSLCTPEAICPHANLSTDNALT